MHVFVVKLLYVLDGKSYQDLTVRADSFYVVETYHID